MMEENVMKRIVINEEYCIGCRLCEIHCLTAHSKSKKILKAFKEEFHLKDMTPRIVVEQSGYVSFSLPCRHCVDAPCIQACMTGAMYRDKKTDAVLRNEDKCVNCNMCIMSCPFGVIRRDKTSKKVASKCDLCISTAEQMPVCVKNCPNEALTLEDQEDVKK
jgi:anaerobic carbon-monoxide dehydrogenase iron sulfur subunit